MTSNEIRLLEALHNAQLEIDLLRSYCRNELSERDQKRLATEISNRGLDIFESQRNEIFRSINTASS